MTAPGVPGRALQGRLQITKGLSGKSDFTISPPPEQTPAGVISVSGCLCGSPFSSIWMPRPEAVCVVPCRGERRSRKCRDDFRDDSWNDFRDDSCDDGPRGDAGARRIGQDRRRGITSLLRPVRRRCFRRHRPVRRCSCRRCGSTWQCVSPRRSVCRSGS